MKAKRSVRAREKHEEEKQGVTIIYETAAKVSKFSASFEYKVGLKQEWVSEYPEISTILISS